MKFRSITRTISTLIAVNLFSGFLVFGAPFNTKQIELEKEGISLIGQLEDISRDVRFNADRLDSLNRSPLASKWSRNHHLTQIRELVNDGLRPRLDRLTEIQSELKDWHQDAIDNLLKSAAALAGDANTAILSHNEKGSLPPSMNPEYQDLISKINEHADKLVQTSDAAGAYAIAHERAQEAGLRVSN